MEFEPLRPHFLLRNRHLMTIFGALAPRGDLMARTQRQFRPRQFVVAPGVTLLSHCLIAGDYANRPTLVIVHGLEGSSSSPDIVGIASKAFLCQWNVVCLNLRNCGNTLHLCPGLYNAGLSEDLLQVVRELRTANGASEVYLAGYSLGGNIVLKLAGELGSAGSQDVQGVCAVSPAVHLDACVTAIESGINRVYEIKFLLGLRQKIRAKNKLYPGKYPVDRLSGIWSIRRFDDIYTAPDAGFRDAKHYYDSCSAIGLLDKISVPTLILAAKDDPMVPFDVFSSAQLQNPFISLIAPEFGGHGGFIDSKPQGSDSDCYWAENRVVQFLNLIHEQIMSVRRTGITSASLEGS